MAYKIKCNGLEVKTKKGENILGSDFNVEIKELDEYKRTFWAIASTESPDRDNDVIKTNGWDLTNYKKNPIGLWSHLYFQHPHFKCNQTRKKDGKLLFQPQFDDSHEAARITWNQYKNGYLNMFSVGFNPMEFNYRDEDNKWSGGREFTKQELLEISAVPVPANPEAGILRSAGLIPEDVNLVKLGYSSEFQFDEQKGIYWNPVSLDLEAFKDPRTVSVADGIKAVSAIPLFDVSDDNKKNFVVGYYFDSDKFDKDAISDWMKANCPKQNIKKFYQIGFEEEELKADIVEEIKTSEEETILEDKEELETLEEKTEEDNIEVKNEVKSLQCSVRFIDSEDNVVEEKIYTIDNEGKQITNLLQKIDKTSSINVKGILEDFKSQIIDEMKTMFEELKTVVKQDDSLENSSEENNELIKFDSSIFAPVEDDEKEEKFTFDSEKIKLNEIGTDVIVESINFKKLFQDAIDEVSGKLKD